ncbi:hypothetical protein N5A92_12375 [Chelativorans sp. EGI FJ00035]|uniref:3'-kinase n=2 Tax=Chelativorans salis TaxID=2978478 RepID=A0ABT2LR41_9HYPH|nr:hypothetical protein [Chelativorans sp. EGI FJ00035]
MRPPPPPFRENWSIASAELLADTATSRVWQVLLRGGEHAIVKDLKPVGLEDELTGILFLEWRNGEGAVRVLARDGQRILMEHAGRHSLLTQLEIDGDDAASEIAAQTINRLHRNLHRAAPEGLQSLHRRFASLFAIAETDRKHGRQSLFVEAASLAEHLLANQTQVRPLHGDLHHENILLGERGWLAIDAKGLLGEPAYDAANLFNNPLERMDLRENPARAAALARILARALEHDATTLLQYGFAHACLSAAWYTEGGNRQEAGRSLATAAAVRRAIRGN